MKMTSPGDQGVKMECRAIPFEPGFRYTATVDVKVIWPDGATQAFTDVPTRQWVTVER